MRASGLTAPAIQIADDAGRAPRVARRSRGRRNGLNGEGVPKKTDIFSRLFLTMFVVRSSAERGIRAHPGTIQRPAPRTGDCERFCAQAFEKARPAPKTVRLEASWPGRKSRAGRDLTQETAASLEITRDGFRGKPWVRSRREGEAVALARSSAQIFIEPVERSSPGLFRRRLVVGGRRVVVEAVVGVLVDMPLVGNAGLGKLGVERRPAAGDAGVQLAILGVDRCLDLRCVGGVRLEPVERNRSVEPRAHAHGQLVDDAAAETEADRAELAGRIGQGVQPFGGGEEIRLHLGRIDLLEQRRALLVVAGIAADGGEPVGGEGDEIRRSRGAGPRPRYRGSGRGSRARPAPRAVCRLSPAGPDSL